MSFYPAKAVSLLFFQNINLEKVNVINHHLLHIQKCNIANDYISQQEGICRYFSAFLNAIENRIYSLQKHLPTIEPTQSFVSSDSEPADVDKTTIWI